MKLKINNIASAGIIYKVSDPAQIFMEIKDSTYPLVAFRKRLCPIGGNWIGRLARNDRNTHDTFTREVKEELNLRKIFAHNLELRLLGIESKSKIRQIQRAKMMITNQDRKSLKLIKNSIIKGGQVFGDFLITIPKKMMRREDQSLPYDRTSYICSYYFVALSDEIWEKLLELQKRFKNLSNESTTIITSVNKIVKYNLKIAFGHDKVIKKFLALKKVGGLKRFPVTNGIRVETLGRPLGSYREYLEKYSVARIPK